MTTRLFTRILPESVALVRSLLVLAALCAGLGCGKYGPPLRPEMAPTDPEIAEPLPQEDPSEETVDSDEVFDDGSGSVDP